MRLLTITALTAALAFAGCAEDDPNGLEPTAKERAAANSLVKQISAIDSLTAQPDAAPQLLTASSFSAVVSMLAPQGMSIALPSRNNVGDLRPCITQTSDTVVYTDCEIAEHVVEGSLSGLDKRLKAELVDVFVISPENHGAATVKASINSEGQRIDGSLELDVMWSAAGADNTVDATAQFDGLMVDGTGCAVAGSVTISGHVSDLANTTRTVHFGPACGDVRVVR